jgi:zinc transport system substrate-binding protein
MKKVFLSFCLLTLLSSCSEKNKSSTKIVEKPTPVVFVSNYPLQFFVQAITANKVDVLFPGKESDDPSNWIPNPEQISSLQNADLIIINGASYEKWMENISLSASKIVNTTAKAEDKLIKYKEAVTHSHGPEGEHAHMGTAFTTWLDFSLARLQAKAIYESLILHFPEHKESFLTNYQKLDAKLKSLDEQLIDIISKKPEAAVVFSHPVYQYFEKRYHVHGHSVHWEPETVITTDLWHDLEHAVDDHKVEWMVWENQPMATSVRFLDDKGIRSIVFNPCGNVPETGDFLTVMHKNISELKKVFH